jgi:predicted transcriptional regulator
MSKGQYTIEVPAAVGRRIDRTARKQRRKPSDLVVEAFRHYFAISGIPEETPTPAELPAIRRGEAAIKRGDYISFDELRRREKVARRPHRASVKVS